PPPGGPPPHATVQDDSVRGPDSNRTIPNRFGNAAPRSPSVSPWDRLPDRADAIRALDFPWTSTFFHRGTPPCPNAHSLWRTPLRSRPGPVPPTSHGVGRPDRCRRPGCRSSRRDTPRLWRHIRYASPAGRVRTDYPMSARRLLRPSTTDNQRDRLCRFVRDHRRDLQTPQAWPRYRNPKPIRTHRRAGPGSTDHRPPDTRPRRLGASRSGRGPDRRAQPRSRKGPAERPARLPTLTE